MRTRRRPRGKAGGGGAGAWERPRPAARTRHSGRRRDSNANGRAFPPALPGRRVPQGAVGRPQGFPEAATSGDLGQGGNQVAGAWPARLGPDLEEGEGCAGPTERWPPPAAGSRRAPLFGLSGQRWHPLGRRAAPGPRPSPCSAPPAPPAFLSPAALFISSPKDFCLPHG